MSSSSRGSTVPGSRPEPRPGLPRDAKVLLGGVGLDALGTGLVLPFLVVYLHEVRHLSLAVVGLLAAVPPTVALLLLAPIGVLIDRVGPRRIQVCALISQIAGALLLSQAAGVGSAALAQALIGVGHAAFWPASQSLVSEIVGSAQRQRYFGISFTLLNAGIGVGGMVAGLVVTVSRPETFTWIYIGDSLSFVVPVLLLLGPLRHVGNGHRAPEASAETAASVSSAATVSTAATATAAAAEAAAPAPSGSYREVLADRPFRTVLVVTFLSSFVGYSQMEAGWTAFARTVADASTRVNGLSFAVNTAVIVGLQLRVIKLIDGRRRTRMLSLMSGIWALSWLVMGLSGLVPGTGVAAVLLLASSGIFALGETLLSPMGPAITNDLAPDHLRGRYNAANSLLFQVAAILGPSAAGVMLGAHLGALYVGTLLLGCALLVVMLQRAERVLPPVANGVRVSAPAGPVGSAPSDGEAGDVAPAVAAAFGNEELEPHADVDALAGRV
ncbi:MAG: MFS transporter [Actinomycetes bacterium]